MIDPIWAVIDRRNSDRETAAAQRRFFIAAGLTFGAGWCGLVALGAVIGDRLDGRHLAIAVPLCLAGVVDRGCSIAAPGRSARQRPSPPW